MNTDRPPSPDPTAPAPGPGEPAEEVPVGVPEWIRAEPPPPRPKFQHRYRTHIVLFVLTFVAMTFPFFPIAVWLVITGETSALDYFSWDTMGSRLWYAVPMLGILGAHEFGHYFYCRKYNVDASLPYFIPAPMVLTGTLGAVIRIREHFPSKRALFDIGIAGPIAGFVVLLPCLVAGVAMSEVVARADLPPDSISLGEPLLFKLVARLQFGPLPPGYDISLHNLGLAAWFGMFATALNLMPFGQLDGGHIAYTVFGRRAAYASIATLAAAIVLTFYSLSWVLTTVMMFVMAVLFGVHHPPVPDERAPLGTGRTSLVILALLIFIACFMPIPVDIF